MQLQVNNHCRQQRILKEKWKRCEIEQERRKQEQARVILERPNHEMVKSDIGVPAKVEMKNSTDLVDGKKVSESLQSSSLVISAENFSVSSTSSSSDCAGSKDEKSAVKDLEGQVSDLQMQVLSLSQDLEDCNRENSRLKKALENVREFVKLQFGYDIIDEMLDFNLVKSQCATQSELFPSNAHLIQESEDSDVYSKENLKGEDQACKDIGAETTDSEFDKDIPLPALETPQFTYEEEHNKKVTSSQALPSDLCVAW